MKKDLVIHDGRSGMATIQADVAALYFEWGNEWLQLTLLTWTRGLWTNDGLTKF